MQAPSSLSLWLSEQAGPLVIIASFLAFLMIVLNLSARNRQAQMKRARPGADESTFVEALVTHGFDAALLRFTYRYLRETQGISFPLEPADRLDEDLGLDGAAVEWAVRDLLQQCGRLYQPGLRFTPLVTVEDLIRFLQASPRITARAA